MAVRKTVLVPRLFGPGACPARGRAGRDRRAVYEVLHRRCTRSQRRRLRRVYSAAYHRVCARAERADVFGEVFKLVGGQ